MIQNHLAEERFYIAVRIYYLIRSLILTTYLFVKENKTNLLENQSIQFLFSRNIIHSNILFSSIFKFSTQKHVPYFDAFGKK